MSNETIMESSTSSIKRSRTGNLDEAYDREYFASIKKKKLDEQKQIGEPPWLGKCKIDELKYEIFNTHEVFDTEKINAILNFLAEQSVYKDVKLFLMKHNFLCIAKYLLENSPLNKTIIYILHITINLCYINEAIDDIGKSKSFIRLILLYLQNCKNEKILREIITLLRLATYEIQINSQSDWIVRFNECKFFGRRIIFLLKSSEYHTGVKLMQLIKSISEINLPEQISFLEQLFDIDKLIHALQLSYTYIIPERCKMESSKDVNFIENWLWCLTTRQMQVGIDNYITNSRFNVIVSNTREDEICDFFVDSTFLEDIQTSIRMLYRIVKKLSRFLYIPKIYGRTVDYLNGILLIILIILEQAEELQLGKETLLLFRKMKKFLSQYWFHIFTQYTSKHIAYILKSLIPNDKMTENEVFQYLFNCVILDRSMIPELRKKMKNVIIACNEIHK